ncbi:hypothetical protein TKK_0004829 [Trichogramma kaykai]
MVAVQKLTEKRNETITVTKENLEEINSQENYQMMAQLKTGYDSHALKLIIGFLGNVFGLFIVCLASQLIINKNNEFLVACYVTDWYEWTAKNRLYLLMIMVRALKPFGWIAGPGIPTDLNTVTFVVKTGMSYITAMMSLYYRSN